MKTLIAFLVLIFIVGCASQNDPIRQRIDSIAQQTQRAAETLRDAATSAAAIGIPGASLVAIIAGAVGTIAGLFNERRRRTAPLRAAMTQVVRSVDAAFPKKSRVQKAALASAQDSQTPSLVREMKTSIATPSQRGK